MLRPRSIHQLLLLGFAIASLPLLLGLIFNAHLIDDFSSSAQKGILEAAEVAQESKNLLEQSEAMERLGRQYLVLNDPSVLDLYRDRRASLYRVISSLSSHSLTQVQHHLLIELQQREADLFEQLSKPQEQRDPAALRQLFTSVGALARGILTESGSVIGGQLNLLDQQAQKVREIVFWEIAALAPIALVLSVIIVIQIMRPLRQMGKAISRMGAGELQSQVEVRGPRDVQQLGLRLESMRKKLLELEDQKTLFLRNISHELKTPLTALREGTQLLNEQVLGQLNSGQQEIVELLAQNTLRLQHMIEDLLQFSGSENRPLALQNQNVDLRELIEQIIAEHSLPLQAKSLHVKKSLALLHVQGDRPKLKAAIGNLISNAIKYAPNFSSLELAVSQQDDWVQLDVRDQGCGIAPEQRERVFEAFYRTEGKASGFLQGSGLGLFIAREFIRMHRGTIHVEDSSQGAHIQIRLPLPQAIDVDSALLDPAAAEHRSRQQADTRPLGLGSADTHRPRLQHHEI